MSRDWLDPSAPAAASPPSGSPRTSAVLQLAPLHITHQMCSPCIKLYKYINMYMYKASQIFLSLAVSQIRRTACDKNGNDVKLATITSTLWPIKNNHLNFSLFLCQICINVSQSCSNHSSDYICRGDVTSF